jgi:hypothetical protein
VWVVVKAPFRFAAGTLNLTSTDRDPFALIACSAPVERFPSLNAPQPVSSPASDAPSNSHPKRVLFIRTQFTTNRASARRVPASFA